MTITVTPNTASTPPRMELSIASSDGSTITAISLTRTAYGATVPTRVQPAPGPSPCIVDDYEAPWGTSVVYTAVITHGTTTETLTSSPVTLSPAFPWAIHPTTPALSVCLDQQDFGQMGVVSLGTVARPSTAVRHPILGAKYRLVTKTGPRQGSQLQMVVATVTDVEEDALWAILDDQTPLFIQFPPAWGWGWEDGYYDIDAASADRFAQYGPEQRRVFTLALERVEAPAGNQQSEQTWADVLTGFATWAAVRAAYANWTAVETDTRS